MFGHHLPLSEQSLQVIEQIGNDMPGGFFIYKATGNEELLYANKAVFRIFGCETLEEFKALTGYTFKGMLYPEDYGKISASIVEQIEKSQGNLDYVEYRIVRKDGEIRWIDDYGHYVESDVYGGLYYVFISDITEKRMQMETDKAVRTAVIEALSRSYNAVWLINDVATGSFSLFRGETKGESIHARPTREALELLDYEDAKRNYIDNFVVEEDRERLRRELTLENLKECTRDNHMFTESFRRIIGNEERYYRIEFMQVKLPNGKTGIVAGFRDVDSEVREEEETRRKLLEAEAAKAENRRLMERVESAAELAELMGSVTSLLSNMPALSFSKDALTGKYLACNQAFAEYANKENPDGVIGLTDYQIFDPVTAAHFAEDDRKALEMDKPYVFFEDVPNAVGTEIRNLQTTKMKFKDSSGRLCTLGMCVDVTEMTRIKSAEAHQQELEARLELQETLLQERHHREQLDNMITAMASDYRSIYHVNLDADEAVCYRADASDKDQHAEGVRFPYLERFRYYGNTYVTEAFREGFLNFIEPENIRRALAKDSLIVYRYLVNRAGKEYYEMIRVADVQGAEERTDGIVHAVGLGLTVIDEEMRDSLARNKALTEALAAAESASTAKTAFLSNMSHEIRTPMNAIIGLDSLALSDETLSDKTKDYLEKIGGSARHLLGLINDILDMSRIESGKLMLRNEEFSLNDMLEQINTLVMTQCSERGLRFQCNQKGKVGSYFIGDEMKLKQVLINILSNAIKFTERLGEIRLDVECTASYQGQSTLKFSVQDTGIGISESFIPKIFDSFTQEDSTRSSKFGSTGLGMAITKNIVEMMNGSISVESKKGVGSTFTVVVTLRECEHALPSIGKIQTKDLSVLVVDDDAIACEHARLVLSEAGVKSDTSLSGEEALHMLEVHHAKHEPYNLVLLDWKMPDMDGIEVARRIRERYDKETTVIILTAYNWDEIMDTALHAGVDSFLSKPLFAMGVLDEFERIARRNNMGILRERKRASLEGRRILLAEDIAINAEIMKEILKARGMAVGLAENGKLALEMFRESDYNHYDAILMDVRMPEMDGLEATAAIRALDRPDAKTVPIVAMTANAFDEDVQKSLQVGMNAHLSKPVEPDILYLTLAELIYDSK